jgi:hypothetical protein
MNFDLDVAEYIAIIEDFGEVEHSDEGFLYLNLFVDVDD